MTKILQGDVSLSAEDMSKPRFCASLHVAENVETPVDHTRGGLADDDDIDEDEYTEDEHRSWLAGSTAVKYLLAGGIAGAGELGPSAIPVATAFISLYYSISNVHSTF